MNKDSVDKIMEGLRCYAYETACKSDCPYYLFKGACFAEIARQVLQLLKHQQSEIERLKAEKEETDKRLKTMYNRCICFRGACDCSDCKQREECESKRSFYHGWYLKNRERVNERLKKG